ncbi:hypothetical protein COBT_000230 [Conglomerata obtusa]
MFHFGIGEIQDATTNKREADVTNTMNSEDSFLLQIQRQNTNMEPPHQTYTNYNRHDDLPYKTSLTVHETNINPKEMSREDRYNSFDKYILGNHHVYTTIQNPVENDDKTEITTLKNDKENIETKINDIISKTRSKKSYIKFSKKLFTPTIYSSKINPHINQSYNVYRYREAKKNNYEIVNQPPVTLNFNIKYKTISKILQNKNIKLYKNTDMYIGKEMILLVYKKGRIRILRYVKLELKNVITKNVKRLKDECMKIQHNTNDDKLVEFCKRKINIMLVLSYFPLLLDADNAFKQLLPVYNSNIKYKNVKELIDENVG